MKKKQILVIILVLILSLTISIFFHNKEKVSKSFEKTNYKNETIPSEDQENKNWFTEWDYELQGEYIVLNKYNGSDIQYTLPAKAIIGQDEYITKLSKERTFENTPIEDLKISDGVIIDNYGGLFYNSNIKKLDFSDANMSYLNSLSFLGGVPPLEELIFKNTNLSNLTSFYFYSSLSNAKLVDFSNADLSGLQGLGNAFNNSKIEKLTFQNAKLDSLQLNNNAFKAANIQELSFNGVKLTSNTYCENVFFNSLISYIDFSNVELTNTISMNSLFRGASLLKKVDLSNTKAPIASSVGHMFENDINLEEVIMDGFEAPNSFDSFKMFYNCEKLKNVTIEGVQLLEGIPTQYMEELTIRNATEIDADFAWLCDQDESYHCPLKKLTLENVQKIEKASVVRLPELDDITILGETNIEQYAFYAKPEAYLPAWVDYIDVEPDSFYGDRYMPILKKTKLTTNSISALKYNWQKDERFISDDKEHNLTYEYNDGLTEVETIKFTAGDHIKTEMPTRETYTFKGWNTKQNGSGKLYTPNEILYVNADITLYAQWRRSSYDKGSTTSGWLGESVRWRYDATDKTIYVYPESEDSDGRLYDFTDLDNSQILIPKTIEDADNIVFEEGITYIGKDFMKQSGLTKVVFPDSLEEIADGAFFNNISNVVNYKPTVKKGNFSFAWVHQNFELVADANGGHFNDNTLQKSMSFSPGYTYYAYNRNLGTYMNYTSNGFELEIPQKEGYTFIEYNTKSDGTGYSIPYIEGKYIINYPCDMTIYAIYQKEKTTITYNYGDGTFEIPSEELFFGENITNEKPIKNDYVFAEWNTKEDGTGIGIYPGQENPFKEDITLYAIYRKTGTIKQEDYINCCSSAQIISFENGEKIRVFSLESEWPSSDSNAYYEVSKDYLKRYGDFRYLDIDDDNYNELITLIATFSDCNEGGFFDTLGEAGAFYNQYSSMPNQFVGRILNPYKHTSNGGTEKYMHGLRFPFIYEHANEIAKKYDLRVFTNGQGAYRVGITPKTIETEISIVDKTEGKVLSGFTIIIRDEEGNLIDFITTEETPSITTLPIGHTYTIEELSSPENYDIGDNTVFTIDISDDSKEVIIEKGNPKSLPINPETVDKIFLVIVFLIASLSLAIYLNKKKETY